MTNPEDDHPAEPTKSERKRNMTALQKIGEALVALPEVQLLKMPLETRLLDAVMMARSLKSHEAIRRQLQYIGKLMRDIDPAPIQAALDGILGSNQQDKAKFHQIERWRDRLVAEGDTVLQTLLEKYPEMDRQQLRQLIRRAQQDVAKGKNTGGETELFRYLRGWIVK